MDGLPSSKSHSLLWFRETSRHVPGIETGYPASGAPGNGMVPVRDGVQSWHELDRHELNTRYDSLPGGEHRQPQSLADWVTSVGDGPGIRERLMAGAFHPSTSVGNSWFEFP